MSNSILLREVNHLKLKTMPIKGKTKEKLNWKNHFIVLKLWKLGINALFT